MMLYVFFLNNFFAFSFTSHSRILCSHRDITVADECLQIYANTGSYSFWEGRFFILPRLEIRNLGDTIYMCDPKDRSKLVSFYDKQGVLRSYLNPDPLGMNALKQSLYLAKSIQSAFSDERQR